MEAPNDKPQTLQRIGGNMDMRRQRSWLVLGIGVGAVGSFLAAVAFAVGQYRKVSLMLGQAR